jgi:ABC-type glycerol-3-phosphate transport system substrate-binding protein
MQCKALAERFWSRTYALASALHYWSNPMRHLIPIILLLALLTACRDAPGPDAPDNRDTAAAVTQTEQVTITLAVEGSSLNRYRSLLEAFEEENPHIRVRLVNTGEVADADESGIRALATSFDVFPYSPNRQGESQYLLDLRPLLDLDPQFDPGGFLPGLLPESSEPLWAIPTGAAYYLTFFDQSAFATAGLDAPELDWTVDDFLVTAVALTAWEGDDVTRWGYVPAQLRYSPLLAAHLAGPLQAGDGLRLADPDVIAAVQWLGDLFTVHQVSPWLDDYRPADRRTGSGGQTAQGLINNGQAAMWHTTHLFYDERDGRVGVTAVPHGPHGLAAEPILYGFAASRGTAHPEAAWQLLHFLSRQAPQDARMFAVDLVPARRSVAAANNYWEQLPASVAPALQYTAENNAISRITYQVANLLQEAFATHIDDNIPVAAALNQDLPASAVPPNLSETEAIVVQEAEPDTTDHVTQLTFTTYNYLFELHQLLANQFQNENPDLAVRLERSFDGIISQLNHVASSDCFITSPRVLDDALGAAVLPLNPLLDLDESLQPADFYPFLLNQVLNEGKLSGIPAWIRVDHIHYNRQLFETAGVPEPAPDWTLADFLKIAQQLTKDEGEMKQFGYAEHIMYLFPHGRTAFGIELVDYSTEPPRFDYEAATEMLAWYVDLVQLYEVQPPLSGDSAVDFPQFQTLLRSGQVAMWPSWQTDVVIAMQNAPLNYEVGSAPIPLGPSGSHGDISSRVTAYYILADSPNREACWEWIKFLSRHPQAAPTGTNASYPAHIKTGESAQYIEQVGGDFAAVAHAFVSFNHTVLFPPSPRWMSPGFEWLREAYREATNQPVDIVTVLGKANEKFSQYRECVILTEASDDYTKWRLCAIQVDPHLADFYP